MLDAAHALPSLGRRYPTQVCLEPSYLTLAIGPPWPLGRYEALSSHMTKEINALREAASTVSTSITAVEESIGLVAEQSSSKADGREVQEMRQMNDSVQAQVASLKAELQGTLKSLETWIMTQVCDAPRGVLLRIPLGATGRPVCVARWRHAPRPSPLEPSPSPGHPLLPPPNVSAE